MFYILLCRSITHDYEQVHNSSTDAEESGVFKNFNYIEGEGKQQKVAQAQIYSDIMRNNEDLLASHMASMASDGGNSSDTNQLVSTTHTSQVTSGRLLLCQARYQAEELELLTQIAMNDHLLRNKIICPCMTQTLAKQFTEEASKIQN